MLIYNKSIDLMRSMFKIIFLKLISIVLEKFMGVIYNLQKNNKINSESCYKNS